MTEYSGQSLADATGATGADVVSRGGIAYSIKRHGTTLATCDSEPVRTPGCIQAHGALLVLRPDTLQVVQASENSLDLLGHSALQLIGRPVSVVVGERGESDLRAFLAREAVERNPLYVFSIPAPDGRELDVVVHANDGVLLLEFEVTGFRGGKASGDPDFYALVKKTVARLQEAPTLLDFCDILAEEVRALTGLDRVMIHKFHADDHGEIVAESRRDGLSSWLGQHYPAGDIPQPAREIFKRIWVRPVPDVSGALAEMVPLSNPHSGAPLDMTHCALRGASTMYTEYLQNMGVTASLTLPIRRGGELWGLIGGHHYAGPHHLPCQLRAACEFLAQVASLQHQAAEDREHQHYRMHIDGVHQELVNAAAAEGNLASLMDGRLTLLDGVQAGGVALRHADRWSCAGSVPVVAQLDALAAWLKTQPDFSAPTRPLWHTDHLGAHFPPATACADVAAGLMAVPLARDASSFALWFRAETIANVHWRGDPDEKVMQVGPHGARLTPRASFELYTQSVHQKSLPWQRIEIEAAGRLRDLVTQLVTQLVLQRAERLADMSWELSRSKDELDAFAFVAGHDLKEPLRGIHRYAHQLLEDVALGDPEQRDKLDGLLRLTLRMDSLLDSLLQFSSVGRLSLEFDVGDLNLIVDESLDLLDAQHHDLRSLLVVPRLLPHVRCDWLRCREIFVRLLSNAMKYNDKADKRIEIGWIGREVEPLPSFPPRVAGHEIYYVRDNGIGIEARHFEQVFKIFKRLHGADDFGGGSGAGLSIVKKLVERHRGQVWIDSTPGLGSTFYFTLPGTEAASR